MTPDTFQIYVVGGYVRDDMLARHPHDVDLLVVGATMDAFMAFGEELGLQFQQVGADFPVFLDARGREWAFARKERKVGPGYHGVEVEFDPSVTLKEDLFRRDLTINAMARLVTDIDSDGMVDLSTTVIDPFDGAVDLSNGILRHVSDHFVEDPVRVLRIARFAARYGFSVADSTTALIQQMCDSGELEHLVPERVWAEVSKAVDETMPHRFFHVLEQTSALNIIFPELWDVNTFWDMPVGLNSRERLGLLALASPGVVVDNMLTRLKAPIDLCVFVRKLKTLITWIRTTPNITPTDSMQLFKLVDAFRDTDFLEEAFWTVDMMHSEATQIQQLLSEFAFVRDIGFDQLTTDQRNSLKGPEIGKAIEDLRVEAIRIM